MRKRENKNCRPFRSNPTPNIKTPKQLAQNFKNLKNTIMASFRAKIGWKRPIKCENKNYHSVSFLPEA